MKTNNSNICENCEKPYPQIGYFCGGCLTQFKCKSCDSILEINNLGCTNCGTPKESKNDKSTSESQNVNSFRLHETLNDRTIEATFSDNVGKDLAGVIRDAYSAKLGVASNYRQLEVGPKNNFQDDIIETEHIIQNVNAPVDSIVAESKPIDRPSLALVVMKNLPNSETEWIVVYSYYITNLGEGIFTRADILEKHKESKRKNDNFSRDLSSAIKTAVRAGYINPLDNGYCLFDKGVNKAIEVISRTSGHVSKPSLLNSTKKAKEEEIKGSKESKSLKNNSETKSLKRLAEINFYPQGKESLESFFSKYQTKNDYERNLLFVYYLEEILDIKSISPSHIYTCYDSLSLKVPGNLPQILRNTKTKTGWVEKNDSGSFTVTIKGGNKIKLWNK